MKILLTTDDGEVLDSATITAEDWKAEAKKHNFFTILLNPGNEALEE